MGSGVAFESILSHFGVGLPDSLLKERAWAIAVRSGSCKSLFLPHSDHFSPRKEGKLRSERFFCLQSSDIAMAQVHSPLRERNFKQSTQMAQRSKNVILARKKFPPRTKEPFSLEIFILGSKFSFPLESFNPRPCLSVAREGLGMKKHSGLKLSFRIESLIFSIFSLEIDIFSILGPLGTEQGVLVWWGSPKVKIENFKRD